MDIGDPRVHPWVLYGLREATCLIYMRKHQLSNPNNAPSRRREACYPSATTVTTTIQQHGTHCANDKPPDEDSDGVRKTETRTQ